MPKYNLNKIVQLVSGKSDNLERCTLCEFKTKTSTAIKLHVKFVHKKMIPNVITNYECSDCLKIFATKEEMVKHYKIHKKHV